jgi:AAA domain
MNDERWFEENASVLQGVGWDTTTPSPVAQTPSFTEKGISTLVVAPPLRRQLIVVDPADIEVRDVDWLEKGFLPQGELTVLQGHGGTSKGTHSCYWAARVTRGETHDKQAGSVLFAAAEDSIATTLKPRLIAAGADMAKVRILKLKVGDYEDGITIPDDVHQLGEMIAETGARLVVIDPILSHLSGKVDSYRDHDVKRSLSPLKAMAESTGCAILAIHHFNKDTTRGAVRSGQASGAFTNTARVVLAMVEDDEDENLRVLEVVKSNITKVGLRYQVRIDTVQVPGIEDPVVFTLNAGDSTKTADELLKAGEPRRGGKKVTAKAMILEELATGQKTMEYLKARGASLGVSGETVWRAANDLVAEKRVDKGNAGTGTPWFWWLTVDTADLVLSSSTPTANLHEQVTSSYTTIDEVSDVVTNSTVSDHDFVSSPFMTNSVVSKVPATEILRQLETRRPELIGRSDITTKTERRQLGTMLHLYERAGLVTA